MGLSKYRKYAMVIGVVILITVFIFIVFHGKTAVAANINGTEKTLKDGIYTGRSLKFPGPMKVSVTVKDGKIVSIKILQHFAPKKHNDMMQELIERIIKQQSSHVDSVTGATISSNALKKAVNNALNKAAAEKTP